MKKGKFKTDFPKIKNEEFLKEFMIGSLLGDGSIYSYKNYNRLTFGHGEKQLEYLTFKQNILKEFNLEGKITKCISKNKRYKTECVSYYMKSKNHPFIKEFKEKYYKENRKNVLNITSISPFSLAIWFMDDGCKAKASYQIYTNSFSKEELNNLIFILKRDYNLDFTYDKNNVLYLKKHCIEKFNNIILPYLLKMFYYKLHMGPV